jgi:hypothetical protein
MQRDGQSPSSPRPGTAQSRQLGIESPASPKFSSVDVEGPIQLAPKDCAHGMGYYYQVDHNWHPWLLITVVVDTLKQAGNNNQQQQHRWLHPAPQTQSSRR